ncbi:MAG TPA: biotin transporter BioY [Candidatus Paenibacillus intestinavium]|nr:biotin transporter BioY [Candidatus Paenibacillus intestinavium]
MKVVSMRSLVYIALFSALFIVFTTLQIKLSFSPVPITLQTLAFVLAGIFLKPRAAFLSIFIVIILGAIGLPVFAGKSGLAYIFGPTGGFIFYFPVGALIISYLTQLGMNFNFNKQTKLLSITYFATVFIVFGLVMSYVIGIPWFMAVLDMSFTKALTLACYPYLLFDFIKMAIAVAIVMTMKKGIQHMRLQQ